MNAGEAEQLALQVAKEGGLGLIKSGAVSMELSAELYDGFYVTIKDPNGYDKQVRVRIQATYMGAKAP